MEKHYFAGANTPGGFFSYFNHIIDPKKAQRIYILKGGSGVGKSTAIKRTAKHLEQKGYSIEYIRCSSDEHSFDGFCAPQLGVAMLDGTAPHMFDPSIPGACEVIVNLGDYLDLAALKPYKNEIATLNGEKSALYHRAYCYLSSAYSIIKLDNSIYDSITDEYKLICLAKELFNEIFTQSLSRVGTQRKLFAEAFTAIGLTDYSPALLNGYTVYSMDMELTHCSSKLLRLLSEYATSFGYDIECYFSTLEPDKILHILIPALNIAITSKVIESSFKSVAISSVINSLGLSDHEEVFRTNKAILTAILENSAKTLGKTKAHHDSLEKIYSKAMDFSRVDALISSICNGFSQKGE